MFKTRLLSGILLVIVAFLTIHCGGWVLAGTLMLVSVIGVMELMRAMKAETDKQKKEFFRLTTAAGALTAAYYLVLGFSGRLLPGGFADISLLQMVCVIAMVVLLMCFYVFTYPRYQAPQIMAAFFSLIYVGVMLSYIWLTRSLPEGKYLVWLIFLCSWGCDTCAYCVGMLIGKHKMAPVLSPKKSIEGAVGGIAGAVFLGVLYAWLTKGNLISYGIICGIGALISMVGDLAASAIKRNQNIKDYGNLIPGHGGILDRFDSVIFTAPIIYYLAVFLI